MGEQEREYLQFLLDLLEAQRVFDRIEHERNEAELERYWTERGIVEEHHAA